MFQSHDTIATCGERQIVRRDQRRQSMGAMQSFKQLEHSPSILLVQIASGLICQQHPRPGDERPGNRYALLFPSREFPRAMLGAIREADFR